VKKLVSEKMN